MFVIYPFHKIIPVAMPNEKNGKIAPSSCRNLRIFRGSFFIVFTSTRESVNPIRIVKYMLIGWIFMVFAITRNINAPANIVRIGIVMERNLRFIALR